MALMTLQPIDVAGNNLGAPLEVPYAPTELSFAKASTYAEVAVPGLEQPLLQFVKGEAETLSLEVFLDATGGQGPLTGSVTAEAEKYHKLGSIRSALHSPPLVRVAWGADFPGTSLGQTETPDGSFTAVVLSVARRFTLFDPEGRPLRAVVTLSLKHYASLATQVEAINYQSADHTRQHVVMEGETLPLIAHDAYADAARWRIIADHNGLDNVRDLVPGTVLELPPLIGTT
jgi:nucleoid-associated protein YgaU